MHTSGPWRYIRVSCCGVLLALSAHGAPVAFERFQVILDRQPFGAGSGGGLDAAAQATNPPVVSAGLGEGLQLCAIVQRRHDWRVGLVDLRAEPARAYWLHPGQPQDGFEVLHVDYETERVELRLEDGRQGWLAMAGAESRQAFAAALESKRISDAMRAYDRSFDRVSLTDLPPPPEPPPVAPDPTLLVPEEQGDCFSEAAPPVKP